MRFAIVGNSGSGKSTLARYLAGAAGLPALDLDAIAWAPGQPAVERPAAQAQADVAAFCSAHDGWVVEGCYGHLVQAALAYQPLLIFLNPGPEGCAANCRSRPWEPHKFESREAQDAHLGFLLQWVADYYVREGSMSLRAHQSLFDGYAGRKLELRHVPRLDPPEAAVLQLLR
jgi:adenylate kinase family enzyme